MTRDDPKQVVKLVAVEDTQEAFAIKTALESEGIECQVVGDLLDASLGTLKTIPAEVWVHRADLERAQQLLQALRHRPSGEAEPTEMEDESDSKGQDLFQADTADE
ncbi:hypothetical protein HRbin36_00262 [bacterium HR36]|nr:hypothetical protein HRbin36_00262 [bacterium HR36]